MQGFFLCLQQNNFLTKKRISMTRIHVPRYFSFVLSFALIIAPLPLSAVAKAMTDRPAMMEGMQYNISEIERDIINESPHNIYLYLGENASNIKRVVQKLSDFDTEFNSPLHQLKNHLDSGFVVGESNAIIDALAYAQITLDENYNNWTRQKFKKSTLISIQ
jgi:hypothetical protein